MDGMMTTPWGPALKLLFIHQNFPGQFKFLAPALAARGDEVLAMTMQKIEPAI